MVVRLVPGISANSWLMANGSQFSLMQVRFYIGSVSASLDIIELTVSDDPAARIITNRRSRPEKSGKAMLSQAQEWIKTCDSHHKEPGMRCGAYEDADLPPRVVEISQPSSGVLEARLIEPRMQRSRYVALSYCWGAQSNQPLTTQRSNYEQHCNKLPIERCAQTIQDAITNTAALGFRYLWVDALCIIQDSDKDKDFQISHMGSIFENASITLVAAYGEDASDGFLSMPPPAEIAFKLPFEYDMEDDNLGTLYASRGDGKIAMEDQAINLRAWTLEERLLSPRKLIYFADRVSWECDRVSLADSGEITNMGADIRLPAYIIRPNHLTLSKLALEWETHSEWTKNIEWYTRRDLTKPLDKLRAIGGIAKKYQQIFKVEYLAGLWDDFLVFGLLWRRSVGVASNPLRPRPTQYRAPTWSWAAIDGRVDYDIPEREEGSLEVARLGVPTAIAMTTKPTIHERAVTLKSSGKLFGGVTGGFIRLRGLIRSVQGTWETAVHEDFGQMLRLRLEHPTTMTEQHKSRSFVDFWPDSVEDSLTGDRRLSLLVLTGAGADIRADGRPDKDDPSRGLQFFLKGIVISRVKDDRYSRVGFFELCHHEYSSLLAGFVAQTIELI
jgi:hypothetical protein